ncbi:AraC-type DNA-binding protein [Terrimicrobium sacchariphilum]|uniref:AraC-type DNA-binding protein n=1 Tax=Terrimicrobium sacchariphilum TaxID=690879 RepID=A0A146G2W5_TERSA|nr:AraC family transcriptional regulator [Terrimicrobium sacchariphilum]GAT31823.1 AraC-type DNA-binding protein [Terrimicrobium sacchariphilum]
MARIPPVSPRGASVALLPENWRNLQVSLIWAYRGRVAEEFLDFSSERGNVTARLLVSGRMTVRRGGLVSVALPGQWMIMGNGPSHLKFERGSEILSIHLDAHWHTGQQVIPESMAAVVDSREEAELTRLGRALEKFVRDRLHDPRFSLLSQPLELIDYLDSQTVFIPWVSALFRVLQQAGASLFVPAAQDDRITRVLHLLGATPLDQPFEEKRLMSSAGMSRSHLNRLFIKHTGLTPRGFAERRRQDYAVRRLREPGVTAKVVALELGFKQLSHFSRWFKAHSGLTPRDYQAQSPLRLLT